MSRFISMAASGVREGWKVLGKGKGLGIPAPSGQYGVGCVDLMHQLEGDDRGLLLRLHYPTEATPEAGYTYSSWYPHTRYIQGYMEFEKMEFTGDLSKITNPLIPALDGAPLCRQRDTAASATFPVIVYSHGLGGMRTCYSATACDLASHGYVVACVEHRDASACVTLQRVPKSGREKGELEDHWLKFYHVAEGEKEFPLRMKQVKQRADEVKKSLDILILLNEGTEIHDMLGGSYDFKQFKGRMDVLMAALMGHSFGGGTTVKALSEDTRFKCGVALDCWMFPLHKDFYKEASIPQPLYFINSHNFQWVRNVQRMMALTKPPSANGITPCRVLTVNGTHHFNQCDLPFMAPRSLLRMGFQESSLDSETAHHVNMDICHAFLRRYLLKDSAYQGIVPNLDGADGHSEHIIFGTNLDLTDDPAKTGAPDSNL